jgi:protease secretion system outer membrane protein
MFLGAATLQIAALLAPGAAAQCLSFGEAMELAASQDPNVEAARAEKREAAADLKEARSLTRPQLTGFGRTGLGDAGAVNSIVQNQFGLRASQRLYDFGDARLAREAARSREAAGEENIRQEQLLSAQDAAGNYLDHLEADAQLRATEERQRYFQDLLRSVEALLGRGGATTSERADVAARLADAEAAALELRFLKDSAATQIELGTGTDLPMCDAASTDAVLGHDVLAFATIDEAVEAALWSNPSIKSLEKRADSFDAEHRREKRARLPVIEVVGIAAYASNGSSGVYDFQERVGIDVSIPLYSGSSLSARSDRAEARGALAGADAARARRQLREDVSITFQRILSLQAQLVSRQSVEGHKSDEFAAANKEFGHGVRTLRDLIETRLDFEDAMLDRIRVEFELKRRRLELLTLTARLPVEADGTDVSEN